MYLIPVEDPGSSTRKPLSPPTLLKNRMEHSHFFQTEDRGQLQEAKTIISVGKGVGSISFRLQIAPFDFE